ncbi:MAG: HAD-IIIC family phosphatase [Pseudomonadota bacterium]|nr:HAD-IIIC family phosphatase [Pseudomonadota bacterium]
MSNVWGTGTGRRVEAMAHWLPPIPNFRAEMRAVQAISDAAQRLEKLAALSQHALSYLETIRLDQALGLIPAEAGGAFGSLRLALLSSATVDHLLPGIRVAALRRRLLVHVHIGAYGQYRQELLDVSSALHRFKPQTVLLALTGRQAIAGIPIGASAEDADIALFRTVGELRNLWRTAREQLHAGVIQQTFLNTAEPIFGSHDSMVAGAPTRLIKRLNHHLINAAAADGAAILDIAGASERDGLDAWHDAGRWLQAKMEIAPTAVTRYGELLARVLGAQRGLSKKCLVLDLDNTLWGGVIGDDGIDGIVLGEGSPSGEAYAALQRYAKHLAQRGIILAVCSKNDAGIAEEAFANHPEMVLKRSDIACFVANWEPKSNNLQLIARQLNIGIDGLVFVDDNPVERAGVRETLPTVAVPELPTDPAHYVRCIADAGYFEAVAFTADDQKRGEQYAANATREAVLQSAGSLEDFLRGLQMSTVFGRAREVDIARVAQLINKTNQFNVTTRRHSLDQVTAFCGDPGTLVLQFRLIDRFGDNGLVSIMILTPQDCAPATLTIDTWVMSCRVFGRELEFEAMNIAVETAAKLGISAFEALYIPTAKNEVVRNLYADLGFEALNELNAPDGSTRWRLQLDQYQARNTHIERRPH